MDAAEKMSPEDAAKMAAINEKIDARRGAANVMPDAPEDMPAPSDARKDLHDNDGFLAKFMPHRKEAPGQLPDDEAAIEAAAGSIKDERVMAEAPAPVPRMEAPAPAAGMAGINPSMTPEEAEARAQGGVAPVMTMPRMESSAAPAAEGDAPAMNAQQEVSGSDALRRQYEDQLSKLMNAEPAPAAANGNIPAAKPETAGSAAAKPLADRLSDALDAEHKKASQASAIASGAMPEKKPAEEVIASPAPEKAPAKKGIAAHEASSAAERQDGDLASLMERLDAEEADAKRALEAITQKRTRFMEAKKRLDALRAEEAAEKLKLEQLLKEA